MEMGGGRGDAVVGDAMLRASMEGKGVEEMKGQEDQQEQHEATEDSDHDSESERHWSWLHYRRVNRNISPIIEVQRPAWSNWFQQYHHTLFDHRMGDTDAELWIYMNQKEWNFQAPWSRH